LTDHKKMGKKKTKQVLEKKKLSSQISKNEYCWGEHLLMTQLQNCDNLEKLKNLIYRK